VFHVEQNKTLSEAASTHDLKLDPGQVATLNAFAYAIEAAAGKFNLTGHHGIEAIITNLIISSILPLKTLNVPRGTKFCDLGTGAGVPGVPLGVYRNDLRGVLVDSSRKKIEFVQDFCKKADVKNITALQARVEDMGKDDAFRESCDFVLSRAMSKVFAAIELAAPLVKVGGFIYIYSNQERKSLHPEIRSHANELGLAAADEADYHVLGIEENGLLFLKKRGTGIKYPRKYAAIIREANRIHE